MDEQQSKEELAARVDDLEQELQIATARLDAYEKRFDRLLTVVLGDAELADDGVVDGASLYELAHSGGGEDEFTEEQRDRMFPAHRMAIDIRRGYADRITGKSDARAAELFRRMMHKVSADGEPQPGVDNSGGTVTIDSGAAKDIIAQFDDDLDTVYPDQVKRAFAQLQTLTKHEDCECDSIDACGHGLVIFQPGSTNRVAANTARLISYLEDLDDVSTDADDAGDSVEADADVSSDDPFGEIAGATPAHTDGGANTVVSNHEGNGVSNGRNHGGGDTTR
jgi:hypothetical protein